MYSFWIHTLHVSPPAHHLILNSAGTGRPGAPNCAHRDRSAGRRGYDSARPITWPMSHSNVCTCMHNSSVLLRRRVLLLGHRISGTGDDPGSTDRLWRDRGVKGKGLFCVHCSVRSVERHETSMPTRLPFAILKSGIAQAKCDRPAGDSPREADQTLTLAKSRGICPACDVARVAPWRRRHVPRAHVVGNSCFLRTSERGRGYRDRAQ